MWISKRGTEPQGWRVKKMPRGIFSDSPEALSAEGGGLPKASRGKSILATIFLKERLPFSGSLSFK